jgi:hypothetical protein
MSRATPEMRELARQLIGFESRGAKSSEPARPAAALVCEKLRPILATLIGNGGFRGLLSRAVALASAEVPWLNGVHVMSDGVLEGLDPLSKQIEPRKFADGSIVLVAQLLGLLNAFIGETLTVRFVQEAWPKISINSFKSDSGGKI